MDLPDIQLSKTLNGEFDYIHLFVKKQSEHENIFLKFKEHLKFAEMSYGKSGTKWSRDLVIDWFKEPRNLQLQRRGK